MKQIKSITKSVYLEIKNVIYLMRFLEYRLLYEKFYEYKYYVKTGRKTLDIFIEDSKSDLTYFIVELKNNNKLVQNKKKEQDKIISIFQNRKDLIQKYFEEPIFNLESAKNLLIEYDSTTNFNSHIKTSVNNKEQIIGEVLLSNEDRIKKVVDFSIRQAKYYYKFRNKSIHMGTRLGGYLFVSGYLKESETESRKQIWERATGSHFGDEIYLYSPYTVKSSVPSTIRHLKELLDFFENLEEDLKTGDIVEIIQKNINKLQKK